MPQKILILQTAFLGDLILSTAFFRAVRNQYPNSEIHLLVNASTETILLNNPDLNQIWVFDKKKMKKNLFAFFSYAKKLKKEKFDLVIAAHFSYRSSILSFLTGAPERIGYKESGFSFLHTKTVSRPLLGPHEVDKLFSLIVSSEDFPSGRERRPFLFPTEEETKTYNLTKKKVLPNEEGYIIIAPSSLWETKRLPEEKFLSIITQILRKRKETVVLIGSKADFEIETTIRRLMKIEPLQMRERERVISLIGKTNLRELMSWIQGAKAVVSNDSSPIHFASAFNIPTVMIYGATIPGFGYGSLSSKHKYMEVDGLPCRPCGIHGGRECPKSHFKCMMDQNTVKIFEALEEVLS